MPGPRSVGIGPRGPARTITAGADFVRASGVKPEDTPGCALGWSACSREARHGWPLRPSGGHKGPRPIGRPDDSPPTRPMMSTLAVTARARSDRRFSVEPLRPQLTSFGRVQPLLEK